MWVHGGWGSKGITGGQGSVGALWVRLQGGKWGCREDMGCIGGVQMHWRNIGVHRGVGVQGVWGPLPWRVQGRVWVPSA